MTMIAMSRRHLFGAGACALTGAVSLRGVASAHPGTEMNAANERLIRKWYAAITPLAPGRLQTSQAPQSGAEHGRFTDAYRSNTGKDSEPERTAIRRRPFRLSCLVH
jgi:hypothetical protein